MNIHVHRARAKRSDELLKRAGLDSLIRGTEDIRREDRACSRPSGRRAGWLRPAAEEGNDAAAHVLLGKVGMRLRDAAAPPCPSRSAWTRAGSGCSGVSRGRFRAPRVETQPVLAPGPPYHLVVPVELSAEAVSIAVAVRQGDGGGYNRYRRHP